LGKVQEIEITIRKPTCAKARRGRRCRRGTFAEAQPSVRDRRLPRTGEIGSNEIWYICRAA